MNAARCERMNIPAYTSLLVARPRTLSNNCCPRKDEEVYS